MVELRLDPTEHVNLPADCYVSVRVGETQKLSKLAATRLYKFPQAGERRYGKIEVFKRIGQCSIDVDPVNQGVREVSIHCSEEGFGVLGFKVAVKPEGDVKEQALEEKRAAGGNKVKAAKEYLAKHSLEMRLSDAMQAVLRERPEDPAEFMAHKLLASNRVVLPPLAGRTPQQEPASSKAHNTMSPAPPAAKPVKKAAARPHKLDAMQPRAEASKASPEPMGSYYAQHFKCAGPTLPMTSPACIATPQADTSQVAPTATDATSSALKPFRSFYKQHVLPAGCLVKLTKAWTEAAQQTSKRQASSERSSAPVLGTPSLKLAALVTPELKAKPSVATWLNPLPRKLRVLPPAPASSTVAPGTAQEAQPSNPALALPSVATWHKPIPRRLRQQLAAGEARALPAAQEPEPRPAAAKMPSVGTWLVPLRHNQQAAPAFGGPPAVGTQHPPAGHVSSRSSDKDTKADIASSVSAPRFGKKPSVGTWLQQRPADIIQLPKEVPFQKKASVGTWLKLV